MSDVCETAKMSDACETAKMSDACETANCSFTGITHISEKRFPDAVSST